MFKHSLYIITCAFLIASCSKPSNKVEFWLTDPSQNIKLEIQDPLNPKKEGNYESDWKWKSDYVLSLINPKEYFA